MTASLHVAEGVDLPLELVTSSNGILAKKGAGKTSAAVVLLEEMHQAGVPVVVVDPKFKGRDDGIVEAGACACALLITEFGITVVFTRLSRIISGGGTCFLLIAAQSIPAKNRCFIISVTPLFREPSLLAGSGFNSPISKSFVRVSNHVGNGIVSRLALAAFSKILFGTSSKKGGYPASISKMMIPRDHQSTAKECP